MEFLSRVLDYLKDYHVKINILGGEPALIKNLREVIQEIKKHDKFICSVLSNSYIRKRYPEILEDPTIHYNEHLVLDFYEDRIEKLGNFDFLPQNDKNNYNVVIKTPNYVKYRRNFPEEIARLNHKNTMFKEYNSRSPEFDVITQSPKIDRKLCSKFPQVPVIDFENQNLRHCSKRTLDSRTFKITKENIDKMMQFKLFQYESYCDNCCENISNFSFEKYAEIIETHEL